jgi:5-methylcytosine-specific restriction endonuclease McrA
MTEIALKQEWEKKFTEKLATVHKRNVAAKVKKVMTRTATTKNGLVARSKKHDVECLITVEDLRELTYAAYGTPCKYSGRILTIDNLVYDHLVPISKGGSSNRENIQVISKFSNSMKGSLDEEHFLVLLAWLKTVPEELAKDISIRLAKGIH